MSLKKTIASNIISETFKVLLNRLLLRPPISLNSYNNIDPLQVWLVSRLISFFPLFSSVFSLVKFSLCQLIDGAVYSNSAAAGRSIALGSSSTV